MILSLVIILGIIQVTTCTLLLFLLKILNNQSQLLKQQQRLVTNLNETLLKKEKTLLVDENRSMLFLEALKVRDAIAKQQHGLHPKAIEDAPKTHSLSPSELQGSYTPAQISAIYEFWSLFNEYLQTYWLTKQGTIKVVFKGSETAIGSEVQQVQQKSAALLRKMDALLTQIKK